MIDANNSETEGVSWNLLKGNYHAAIYRLLPTPYSFLWYTIMYSFSPMSRLSS